MIRQIALLSIAILVGCVPPRPTPATPVRLSSAATPDQVVQRAARVLAEEGFQLTVSDAAGGVVSAWIEGTPERLGAMVKCSYQPKSIAYTQANVRLVMSVTARASGSGSEVSITPRTTVSAGQMTGIFASATKDDECTSGGAAEASIAASVK